MKTTKEQFHKELSNLGLTKKDILVIDEIIEKQILVHVNCEEPLADIVIYIIGKEVEGIEYVKVFDRNKVVVEILDTSYTRMRNLTTLEDWNTKFILKLSYTLGELKIKECSIFDIIPIEFKKAKKLTYGVTDGEDVVKVNVVERDIKGLEYTVLRELVAYTFNKRTGKKKDLRDLDYILLQYT